MADYSSILDWINYSNPYDNPFTPFLTDNLPYDICYGLWEILGGTLAWLINLLFPDNWLSKWLLCDEVMVLFSLILFMLVIFIVAFDF